MAVMVDEEMRAEPMVVIVDGGKRGRWQLTADCFYVWIKHFALARMFQNAARPIPSNKFHSITRKKSFSVWINFCSGSHV
mmetsp:Transcript_36587/g.78011  ORF Transcript_36587/g.78011 Transcript_36587/m.78011 type:complete len:80 (+) Transcript_36587:698-937(+)